MINDVTDLIERCRNDDRLRGLLKVGGWYLVGSRAAGFADELSDWDTIILSSVEAAESDRLDEMVDELFPIERPRVQGTPTLEFHRRWRAAQAVEIEILGPTARRRRSAELAEWTFELRHAVPLSPLDEAAENYRSRIAARFRRECARLAGRTYAAFRQSRNEAVATLGRAEAADQVVTAAACVGHAARYWFLAEGLPHPAGKWLLTALRRTAPSAVLAAMADAVDARRAPGERFESLWRLWELVDDHGQRHHLDPAQLAGSPFARGE